MEEKTKGSMINERKKQRLDEKGIGKLKIGRRKQMESNRLDEKRKEKTNFSMKNEREN